MAKGYVVEVFEDSTNEWFVSSNHITVNGVFADFWDANSWGTKVCEDFQNAGFWNTPVRIREV